ncbi:MAG TPA: DUF4126 domain-containing protein [Acidimicrobiia bacterium]|jgi:hypothetical protein
MELVAAVVTGFGLAGAAGLNAYIPLLVVGLLDRFEVIALAHPYDVLSSTVVLIVLGVLFLIEVLVDKIPAVDTINDAIQTVIRPVAGALLFAGSTGALTSSPDWLLFVAGLLAAGGVHATKTTVRPAVNVSTAGVGAPVLSTIEDIVSAIASILAVLAPALLILFVALVVWSAWRVLKRFQRRLGRPASTSGA